MGAVKPEGQLLVEEEVDAVFFGGIISCETVLVKNLVISSASPELLPRRTAARSQHSHGNLGLEANCPAPSCVPTHPFTYLCIYSSGHPPTHLSICLLTHLPIHPSTSVHLIHSPTHISIIYSFFYPPTHFPYICLLIHLSTHTATHHPLL